MPGPPNNTLQNWKSTHHFGAIYPFEWVVYRSISAFCEFFWVGLRLARWIWPISTTSESCRRSVSQFNQRVPYLWWAWGKTRSFGTSEATWTLCAQLVENTYAQVGWLGGVLGFPVYPLLYKPKGLPCPQTTFSKPPIKGKVTQWIDRGGGGRSKSIRD